MPNDCLDRPNARPCWRKSLSALLALSLALPLLQGCAMSLVAAGVGAAVGATVMIRDRRGQEAIIDDKQIEFKGQDWPGSGSKCQVAVNSYNRVALLTGQCQNEAAARSYAERVSKVPKVRRVVDEITIGPFASLQRQGEDTLITSRAKLALVDVDIKGFDPTRVTVVTESGIVYLMGLVTAAEAEAAVEQVRYVPGVVKVVKVFEIIKETQAARARATDQDIPEATAGGLNATGDEISDDTSGYIDDDAI